MRIGQGYDAHRFAAGRRLVLAGVEIEHEFGLKAHSDGDVLIHALCDALLGAGGLGDIGGFFPDSDPAHADRDSTEFLVAVRQRLEAHGLGFCNADITVIAQVPKLAPHVPAMRERLAGLLATDASRVNVKATTAEGLGALGREEGIAAHAVVLLEAGK